MLACARDLQVSSSCEPLSVFLVYAFGIGADALYAAFHDRFAKEGCTQEDALEGFSATPALTSLKSDASIKAVPSESATSAKT